MTEMPEKETKPSAQPTDPSSASPSASPSANSPVPAVLQTIAQIAQTRWTQLRPTALQGLQWMTQTLQQWSQQLETQEKTAQAQGQSTARPIDWTPVKTAANTFWAKTQPLWQRSLDLLRPRLPEAFKPLSDRTLSGILAGTLLLILWFFSLIPAGQTTPPPLNRPTETQPQTRSTDSRSTPPMSMREKRQAQRQKQLERDYNNANTSYDANTNYDANASYDSVPVAIPDRLTSDRIPVAKTTKPAPFPKPESAPVKAPISTAPTQPLTAAPAQAPERLTPPPETLSPDAQKRAKLRQDLDVIAGSLIDNAIVGIRPQFSTHFLTITLSDRWYNAPELTQDKLANSLLVIAQGKEFTQLQLESADGTMLARSPVVGDGMVILQRTR